MKKLLLAILFVPLLTFAAPKNQVSKPVKCFKLEYLQQELEKSKEVPIITSRNDMTNGSMVGVFYNEETGTWTIIEFDKNFSCILGYGVDKKIKI